MNGTWSIFDEMERLRRGLDRAIGAGGSFGWDLPFSRVSFLPGRAARAYPLINIADEGDRFVVEALAPGLDPGSIEITALNNEVTIAGEKPPLPEQVRDEKCHRVERSSGRFRRTVQLDTAIERDEVKASYSEGMLRLIVPKAASTRPRTIAVEAD